MNLADTLRELDGTAKNLKLPDLRRLISTLRPEPREVEPYIHFTDNHYARNLIHKASGFEALVLCWLPGQRSPIHDHANSICAVYVVEGKLSADNYRRMANGHVARTIGCRSDAITPTKIGVASNNPTSTVIIPPTLPNRCGNSWRKRTITVPLTMSVAHAA